MDKDIIQTLVQKSVQKGIDVYTHILLNQGFHHYELPINCETLDDPELNKKTKYGLPESLKISFFQNFDQLEDNIKSKSCLYFFEFKREQVSDILEAYKAFDVQSAERNKSGLKDKPDEDTNILYVGKVKKDVGARLSTHFGYAHAKTGGLQLRFWAKSIKLELKVHLIVFENNLGDYINPLELELTKELKPLIGKSK
jgi:hypothetical protein